MTITHVSQPPRRSAAMPAAGALARRSLATIRRLPSEFAPALLTPVFQVIALSGTYFAVTRLPGFPTDRSVNWFLPFAVLVGSAFAGLSIGFTTISDLESGFYDRLRLAPVPRRSLLVGPLVAACVRAVLVVSVVLGVGTAMGARPVHAVEGVVIAYVAGLGVCVISTGWGLGLAYRFGDMRAAALMQLTPFLAFFLTDAQTPLDVMRGWLRPVARVNPFTDIVHLARVGFVFDVSWDDIWGGVLAVTVLGALSMRFAHTGLARLDT